MRLSSAAGCELLARADSVLRYDLLGLNVRSELPLAAEQSADGVYQEQLQVRLGLSSDPASFADGELVARLGNGADGYEVRRAAGLLLARFGESALLAIDPNRGLLRAAGSPDLLAYVVPNTGLALYLMARGSSVLHASAVEWRGRVHAVLGATKAGKTTLSALLCAAGATLVTDDTLRVALEEGGHVTCWGGTRRLRLRPSAAEVVTCLPVAPLSHSPDGRVVLDVPLPKVSPWRLQSLWFPRPGHDVLRPDLVPLTRSAALERLLEAARVRGLCEPALLAAQFRRFAALARSLPAFEARLPWGPPFQASWGQTLLGAAEATHAED